MAYTPPQRRICTCRCALHHGERRTSFNDPLCGCVMTCATQPMTLLVEQWHCALFLHPCGALWHVPQAGKDSWAWEYAGEIDNNHDVYEASVIVEDLLRLALRVVDATLT